jgi:16S rRNA (adenine(1408)-N(1))-methyltransferase
VGAGDGAYVLHRARRDATTFAVAIDASPDGLIRGAWQAHRAHLGNVAFLVEGLERFPAGVAGIADEVTVHFPWGSLLRGLVQALPEILRPLASLARPGGEVRLLLAATERDGYREITPLTLRTLASAYTAFGLALIEARWATPLEVAESRSSWAKRLGPRPAVIATYRAHSRRSSRTGRTSSGTPSQGTHSTSNEPS